MKCARRSERRSSRCPACCCASRRRRARGGTVGAGDCRRRDCRRRGSRAQGLSAQGLSPQGLSAQGLSAPQGLSAQGLSAQGSRRAQGLSRAGLTPRRASRPQGVSLMGTDLVATDIKGVDDQARSNPRHRRPTSAKVPHVLTNVPDMSAGPGNYISVGGGSAVGHYAVAHLVDAHGNSGRGSRPLHRRREGGSDAEPVPPRRRAGQPGRALRRLLLPQVERAVDVAVPVQRHDQERVGDGDPRRIPATRTSSSSRARRPASRRSARATGVTSPGRRRQAYVFDSARRALGALGRADVPLKRLLRRLHERRARRRTARTARATRRTARWSICSTPGRSSGRTPSRTR